MLSRFKEEGLLKARGKQRTDSTHILAAIKTLNRLELVAETIIHTLNVLATVAPEWLKGWVPAEWYNQYEKRIDEYRLPQDEKERQVFAETIGTDGHLLLKMINSSSAPDWLLSVPAVETMRQIWVQQYYLDEQKVHWRAKGSIPPASVMISSPHDVESRMSSNHKTTWNGYKVHLTETCDKETPHLITSVVTTSSTEPDNNATEQIHLSLEEKELLPNEHLVDAGYPSTDLLVDSQKEYSIELVCPMRRDNSWQARTDGAFDISHFAIDWENQRVTCPQGKTNSQWKEGKTNDQEKIKVRFHKNDCQHCPKRTLCTKSKNSRELSFSPREKYLALQEVRKIQNTEAFKERYNQRAGIEGTISQAVYALGMRRCRYRGLAKTHLQHVLTACAINLKRVVDWFSEKPRSQTRKSRFAALAA
jgi:transposase